MWQILKNFVGAKSLSQRVTILTKNLLKGECNSLKNLLKGDRNSPLLKVDQSLDEPNPNPLTFA